MSKTVLVTGGCGFVGRHLVKALLQDGYTVWIVDNLSTGRAPERWIPLDKKDSVIFIHEDAMSFFLRQLGLIPGKQATILPKFEEVYHLASVVGGRAVIEGDPMAVAIDLAIDSIFFRWVVMQRSAIGRVLYASSSAAYPVDSQTKEGAIALQEDMIQFKGQLGMPDMTYGWSKLTGEYLSQIAARQYGVSVACVRPFSGYGGDQDISYPVPAIALRVAKREDPLIIWGTGEQGRDFVHIDDCIAAIRQAITHIHDGSAVNIGTGKLTTFKQVAGLFAELARYSPELKPLVNKPEGVQSRYSNPTYMKKLLNWTPTISLEQGFSRVLSEQEQVVKQAEAQLSV